MRGQNADSKKPKLSVSALRAEAIDGPRSGDLRQQQLAEIRKLLVRAAEMNGLEESNVVAA